jgi:hypothetical protein
MSEQKDNLKEKVVLVIDCGLFVEFCIRLSKDFKKVYYHTPWVSSFPTSKDIAVGTGFKEIERIDNMWDIIDEVDLFVFPDVYFADLQQYLRNIGKRVWGMGGAEELELYRYETKEYFKKIGLPVQPVKQIHGLDKLREHLKKVENKYIKTSLTRGDFETFHHENYRLTEPILDKLEKDLGVQKQKYEFIVEDAIDGDDIVETGLDIYTVDGEYPQQTIMGFEIKDCGYSAVVKDYKDISPIITDFNNKIAPTLKKYGARGFFSTEIRVGKDKVPYMIDFCSRNGSPPNELFQEMFDNLGEIIWYGADGIMVQPKFNSKFGVEVLIHSDWANDNWQAVYYPKEIDRWVKLRNVCKIDDIHYIVPQADGMPEIGAVIATGNTLEEAIEKVKEYASQIEGYRIDIKLDAIDKGLEELKKAEKLGIKF